jgi:hypothetical protein
MKSATSWVISILIIMGVAAIRRDPRILLSTPSRESRAGVRPSF